MGELEDEWLANAAADAAWLEAGRTIFDSDLGAMVAAVSARLAQATADLDTAQAAALDAMPSAVRGADGVRKAALDVGAGAEQAARELAGILERNAAATERLGAVAKVKARVDAELARRRRQGSVDELVTAASTAMGCGDVAGAAAAIAALRRVGAEAVADAAPVEARVAELSARFERTAAEALAKACEEGNADAGQAAVAALATALGDGAEGVVKRVLGEQRAAGLNVAWAAFEAECDAAGVAAALPGLYAAIAQHIAAERVWVESVTGTAQGAAAEAVALLRAQRSAVRTHHTLAPGDSLLTLIRLPVCMATSHSSTADKRNAAGGTARCDVCAGYALCGTGISALARWRRRGAAARGHDGAVHALCRGLRDA